MSVPIKVCKNCQQEFPATPEYFNRDASRKDGFHPSCKTCRHAYRAKHYRETPELRHKARKRANDWFRDNPERVRKRRKAQYWANPQAAIDRARHWREENPEHYRATQKTCKQRHYRQNREAYRVYVTNRRARLKGALGEHTANDIRLLYEKQEGQCHWCGVSLTDGYHVDHVIPISRGGSNDSSNLVLTCEHCNCSKNDRLPSEWKPIPM